MTDPRENIFQLLRRHGVVFAVIGGHAVSAHGFIRATEDHDIVFLRTPANEQRLLAALSEIHARWIADERDPATGSERQIPVTPAFLQSQHLMMLLTDAGFLDIFDYIPGSPEASVEQFIAEGLEVAGIRYASRAWLLRMKRAAGRPQDLLDLENLQAP
jgi:hypothetical protein